VTSFKELEDEAINTYGEGAVNKPERMMQTVRSIYPEIGIKLDSDFSNYKFKLIMNQLRKQDNTGLGGQICKIIEKHLGLKVDFAGNIAFDDHVHDAICQRASFLDRYPYTRTASDLRELSNHIVSSIGEQLLINYS
jgi:MinD-like ATPase involved in chromosome partitioning or flagellar assembly